MMNTTDQSICPICAEPNNCMAHCDEPCWCNQVKVPKELLALVPENKKNQACICLNCIQNFKENPSDFRVP